LGGFVGASDTTMSVANVGGFAANEILSAKKLNATGFATEYLLVQSASRDNPSSDTDFSGKLYVVRGYGSGTSGHSGSLGDTPSTAQTYSGSQVIVSTGKVGTGYIRLNANPSDPHTPYIDIVERTGSGIYDVDLKARLGDLSGLSSARLHGANPANQFGLYSKNVYLEGAIVANTGSIGGIEMQSGKLYNGVGTHGNSNTGFYVDSGSNFSLGDKLVWDGSDLSIEGSITLTGGTGVATPAQVSASLNASSSALQGNIDTVESNVSGAFTDASASLASDLVSVEANISGAFASTSASLATTIGNVSSSTAQRIMTDAKGLLLDVPASPSGEGLFLNYPHMGFFNNSEFTSFISASGGFLFKADDNNLISFGQSTLGGDGLTTKSFVLKSDNVFLSGSKVNILGERFFLGGNSQYISGSGGNIEISSSKFHVRPDGNVVMNQITASSANLSGKVTSTEGSIGGFDIEASSISSQAGGLVLNADGGITGSKFRLTGGVITDDVVIQGDLSANSISTPSDGSGIKATITSEGYAKFISASIGGFHVSDTEIKDTDENLLLKSNGQITASNAKISGNITITAGSAKTVLDALGDATASLESSVTTLGQATASLQSATGSLQTNIDNVESNVSGAFSSTSASLASTIGEVSSSTAQRIMTDAKGLLLDIPAAPSGEGLYLNYPYLGFYDNSDWNAYISASGAFLFKADDNNLISFGESVSGGDGVDTKSFVLKSDNVFLSGSKVNILGERFFLGGSSQFVSGSNGNIEISSSKFHIQPDGDVIFKGDLTGASGTFGGTVTVGGTSLTTGNTLNANTTADNVGLGNVENLTAQNQAQTGLIAGTTITGGGITLNSGGNIKGGQTNFNTGTGFFLGYANSNYQFSIGHDDGNRLTWDGSNLIVSSSTFVLGGSSQFISGSNGNIEISSSNFHLDRDGNVDMSGKITSTEGSIGGFTINSTEISASGLLLKSSGQITASAVDLSGKVTATSGEVGGFTIDADEIKSTNLLLDSSNEKITVGSSNAVTIQGGGTDNFITMGKTTFGQTTTVGAILGMDATVPTLELFKDANNSFIFNNSGIDIKTDTLVASGSSIRLETPRFYLGESSQFISGSNGNIEISSSKFHVQPDGDVVMNNITASNANLSGKVTATSGEIGGMSIETNSIESTADFGDGTTTIYTVTVNGSSKYEIDGVQQTSLTFIPGNTYRFNQADDSNENHPLRFVQTSGGTDYYTTGVTINGSPGTGGAYTQIAVTQDTPTQLYYRCTAHSGMGGSITVDKTSPLILDGNSGHISASRFLFTGGKITGSSVEIDVENVTISGSSVNIQTPKFYLGQSSQYISGSNGNIEISSSGFHLDSSGNATMQGTVTATTGDIGGFAITPSAISSSNNALILNSNGSAIFTSVQITGQVNATSGTTHDTTTSLGVATASLQEVTSSLQEATASLFGSVTSLGEATSSLQEATASLFGSVTSLGEATASLNTATGSLQSNIDTVESNVSGAFSSTSASLASDLVNVESNVSGAFSSTSASLASTINTVSSSTAQRIMTDAKGLILDVPASPSGEGLFLNYPYLGFYGRPTITDTTYVVTAAGGAYYIDGVQQATVELQVGYTYRFDTSAVGSHPFRFSTTSNGSHGGGSEYTTGVTVGSGYVDIEVTSDTPSTLYYYCTIHSNMGGQINVVDNSEYKAFISASGGFLFKADDNNLISFGESVSGGDGVDTKSFVLKSDNVFLSGSKVNILGERFFLGGNSQFLSGSNGKLEISSSGFHLDRDGNATLSGSITANDGQIGGYTISETQLEGGAVRLTSGGTFRVGTLANASTTATTNKGFFADNNGNVLIKADTNNSDYIKFDADASSGALEIKTSKFELDSSGNVTMNGSITSTTGNIGGFVIGNTDLSSNVAVGDGEPTSSNIQIHSSKSGPYLAMRRVSDSVPGGKIVLGSNFQIQSTNPGTNIDGERIELDGDTTSFSYFSGSGAINTENPNYARKFKLGSDLYSSTGLDSLYNAKEFGLTSIPGLIVTSGSVIIDNIDGPLGTTGYIPTFSSHLTSTLTRQVHTVFTLKRGDHEDEPLTDDAIGIMGNKSFNVAALLSGSNNVNSHENYSIYSEVLGMDDFGYDNYWSGYFGKGRFTVASNGGKISLENDVHVTGSISLDGHISSSLTIQGNRLATPSFFTTSSTWNASSVVQEFKTKTTDGDVSANPFLKFTAANAVNISTTINSSALILDTPIINTATQATSFAVIDNNANALNIGGGILNIDTTDNAEKVTMSGDLEVAGTGSFGHLAGTDGSLEISGSLHVNGTLIADRRKYTSALSSGWYTIAVVPDDFTGQRKGLAEFQISERSSGDHMSVLFNASHHFGTNNSNDITVLANSRFSGTNYRYIRIKDGGTYDGAVLQVYLDSTSSEGIAGIVGGNIQEDGWILKDWIPDATDPGNVDNYGSMAERCKVDLDRVVDGGILTTGKIIAQDTIESDSDVIAYTSSDKRLKDNLIPIKDSTIKLKKLTGYEFDWNDKQKSFDGHDVGVIAQEVEKVIPEIVQTRDNGYKAVKYEKIVPLLIESIKEQQSQIDELKKEVEELKNA